MPSGRVHAAITTLSSAGLIAASVWAGQAPAVTFALAGGCLAGLLVTPDLDENEPVGSHAMIRRNLGRLPAFLWSLLWFPYSRALPHRHWLSHAPLAGTLIRAAYLTGIFWLACALVGIPWPWDRLSPGEVSGLSGMLLGLGISDALHWTADLLWSRLRHPFSRKRRWVLDDRR